MIPITVRNRSRLGIDAALRGGSDSQGGTALLRHIPIRWNRNVPSLSGAYPCRRTGVRPRSSRGRLSTGHALWRAREPSSRRQHDPQAARLPGARRDRGVAAVQPRDLPHQRETEARALALAAHAVERREYLVAL